MDFLGEGGKGVGKGRQDSTEQASLPFGTDKWAGRGSWQCLARTRMACI